MYRRWAPSSFTRRERLERPTSGSIPLSKGPSLFADARSSLPRTIRCDRVECTASRSRLSTIRGTVFLGAVKLRVDPLYETLWVYVKLDEERHRVDVYRGDVLVRSMIASGGRPGHETPEGVFRIQNRGYHFFSQKYQEGAYYWVRIFGNYLFHSVPVDIHGNVIKEEAEKLGCPASHGCVRLSFPDAQWFYETVPDGTLVVIDRT